MRINYAHLQERASNGGIIDFVVFEANANNGLDSGRAEVLNNLTERTRLRGLKIDQSALAFYENGRNRFYGSRNLVAYLGQVGVPQWTHYIDI